MYPWNVQIQKCVSFSNKVVFYRSVYSKSVNNYHEDNFLNNNINDMIIITLSYKKIIVHVDMFTKTYYESWICLIQHTYHKTLLRQGRLLYRYNKFSRECWKCFRVWCGIGHKYTYQNIKEMKNNGVILQNYYRWDNGA